MTKLLFDSKIRAHRLRRIKPDALFLHQIAKDELSENLISVNKALTNVAVVTDFAELFSSQDVCIVSPDDVLDFKNANYDLIIHFMALDLTNDPVGQLIQCFRALKPDGLFLAVCFGGETLVEARAALLQAEIHLCSGAAPRFHPMADVRDLGALLQRAGFALPVADRLSQTVSYETLTNLFTDIRGMGAGNALSQRHAKPLTRSILACAETKLDRDDTGRFDVTFDLMFLSGWAPHESQQKPLQPGSAKMSLLDALSPDSSGQSD